MSGGEASNDWQPARLIPTAGIKGTREQEQRSTSALLSVMAAVPEFGRALVGELGAPRGKRAKLHTFAEISLDDGKGGTVRPDGAIVVESGKTRWTALVEVKTGANPTDDEQVLRYVDVAIREGFDGVLIIDNNILGGASDVPVTVPKSKLRRADVWQLSWWRILTEAILQHDYRGVSDPDQAWILSELIAYLVHERSGAAELSDMGKHWVRARDGARHDTLNVRQPEVDDVARKWEQFVHWVALGFVQETGADVTPTRIKTDLAERIENTKRELVERGSLTMKLRIPDAVGSLSVCADLRAQMVTTSVSLKAPGEGRPTTRVNWLLRQLRDAPDDLRIETKFVGARKSTAALLGQVRDEPKRVLLADDPKREPREFTLSLSRTMGIKKGSGPGSFITETRQQALDFYRDLVQRLDDWRPKAPRLRNTAAEPKADTQDGHALEADLAGSPTPSLARAPDDVVGPRGTATDG